MPNTIKRFAVIMRHTGQLSATTIESYDLRGAITAGFDFLSQGKAIYANVELTVVEIPKEPVP